MRPTHNPPGWGLGSLNAYSIVTTGPNMEASVCKMLDLFDFDHVWLRVKRKVVYRGRLIQRTFSLFPSYLFVMARYMFRMIESIIGVRGFVRFGGIIETVPARVVDRLRERADARGILAEDSLPYMVGQSVYVKIGGQEQPGVFRDYMGPARVSVTAMMFGRECDVQARLGDCRARD